MSDVDVDETNTSASTWYLTILCKWTLALKPTTRSGSVEKEQSMAKGIHMAHVLLQAFL